MSVPPPTPSYAGKPVVAQVQIPSLRQLHMFDDHKTKKERSHAYQMDPVRFGMKRMNVGYLAVLKKIQRRVKEGDLALPYGHRSYEFKMETPVLVIGATLNDKVIVDMNLARITDGSVKYVEERQAVIKFERDGEFYIRNIGKEHVIKLDGREIQPNGETRKLSDQCMITIGEEDFRFDVNAYIQCIIKVEIQNEAATRIRKESIRQARASTDSV